jgi:2-polyprenyl-6-methoxyphenol hydroxylase-like FAD-dependent oxidoreductase
MMYFFQWEVLMVQRILITGASVAGNTAAWWLTQHGVEVELVERAPAFRDGGQNVDVRGNAREVLRKMGLEAAAFERSTKEKGTDWVREDNSVIARFEAADSTTARRPNWKSAAATWHASSMTPSVNASTFASGIILRVSCRMRTAST